MAAKLFTVHEMLFYVTTLLDLCKRQHVPLEELVGNLEPESIEKLLEGIKHLARKAGELDERKAGQAGHDDLPRRR